jgi:hypothetical protein
MGSRRVAGLFDGSRAEPGREDRRRLTRERGTLLKERIQHTNRTKCLASFWAAEGLRTGDGRENGAREADVLSKVGRGRIARFGCPRCGGDEIRPWGKAGGKPRYCCMSCRKTFNPAYRDAVGRLASSGSLA